MYGEDFEEYLKGTKMKIDWKMWAFIALGGFLGWLFMGWLLNAYI